MGLLGGVTGLEGTYSEERTLGEGVVSRYIEMDSRVNHALEIVNEVWAEQISPDSLAEEVNLSASRFRVLFKSEVGTTITRYIRTTRLLKAAELLTSTYERVSEISYAVGFEDPGYFAKAFRRSFGCSPSEYRRRAN